LPISRGKYTNVLVTIKLISFIIYLGSKLKAQTNALAASWGIQLTKNYFS
jgi:hypothetical protein